MGVEGVGPAIASHKDTSLSVLYGAGPSGVCELDVFSSQGRGVSYWTSLLYSRFLS